MKTHSIVPEQCAVNIEITDHEDILREVARRVAPQIELDEKEIFKALKKRESTGSTGLAKGVALPHCALPNIQDFAIGAMTLATPVDCNSLDGNPADIIIYIIGPEQYRTEHIRILGTISRRVKEASVRDQLRALTSAEDMASMLHSWFPVREHEDGAPATILLLYIQKQELYKQVLETISLEDDASIAVSKAKRVGSELQRLPLFSGFWKEQENEEIHRVEVVMPRHGVNQLIRRIEEITKGNRGVQICAIDLNHSSGSLDF